MAEKIKYRLKVLRALHPFSRGINRFMLINLLISLMAMGLGFLRPLFYKLFIDDVILDKRLDIMPLVVIGYLSVFFVNILLTYAKNYCTNRWVNRVTFRAKMKILRGFFSKDFSDYDTLSVGDMKMRLEDDTACIASYAGKQTTDYIISYATLFISTTLLFFIEWRLAMFSCISIPLTFWLDHIVAKREAVVLNNQRDNDQKMSSWLHASVQGWREIKALNLQKHEECQFASYIHKFAITFGTWINYWVVRALVIPIIKEEFLMQFSLYFFGGLLIIGGRFEIGSLLVFMQYYTILSDAVKSVSDTDAELLSFKPQSDRVLQELEQPVIRRNQRKAPDKNSRIEFNQVSYAYPNTELRIISNLSFCIASGERVAITGKSGAGKTTVLKLIMGMLRPVTGQVLFSGIDVNEISLDAMQSRFGFVMQDNVLFNATIRENLLYGKTNAMDDELFDACKKAYIWDFILSLPDGLQTVIGERGIKLSGGQKQRIVLARQFLRDVDVYIFDEATSSLDQNSESIIHDAINCIGRDKTIIVAAHRQSSLSLCDREIALTS